MDLSTEETKRIFESGQIDVRTIAKTMTPFQFAYFLETFCNSFSKEYENGKEVGKKLHSAHCTLQATVFRYMMGIIAGLGVDHYTDGRNEMAVACAKKISDMVDNGELKIGWMI
jgi:hypothetical protein